MGVLLILVGMLVIISLLVVNHWRRRRVVGVRDAQTHAEDKRLLIETRWDPKSNNADMWF